MKKKDHLTVDLHGAGLSAGSRQAWDQEFELLLWDDPQTKTWYVLCPCVMYRSGLVTPLPYTLYVVIFIGRIFNFQFWVVPPMIRLELCVKR